LASTIEWAPQTASWVPLTLKTAEVSNEPQADTAKHPQCLLRPDLGPEYEGNVLVRAGDNLQDTSQGCWESCTTVSACKAWCGRPLQPTAVQCGLLHACEQVVGLHAVSHAKPWTLADIWLPTVKAPRASPVVDVVEHQHHIILLAMHHRCHLVIYAGASRYWCNSEEGCTDEDERSYPYHGCELRSQVIIRRLGQPSPEWRLPSFAAGHMEGGAWWLRPLQIGCRADRQIRCGQTDRLLGALQVEHGNRDDGCMASRSKQGRWTDRPMD
jgi:hypothetical protein